MFNFEIKLSMPACELLFALIEYNKHVDKPLKKGKTRLDTWSKYVMDVTGPHSHFISHARQLSLNGLITKITAGENPGKDWRITPKGYLVAQVIQMEIEEARDTARKLKTLKQKQLACMQV